MINPPVDHTFFQQNTHFLTIPQNHFTLTSTMAMVYRLILPIYMVRLPSLVMEDQKLAYLASIIKIA